GANEVERQIANGLSPRQVFLSALRTKLTRQRHSAVKTIYVLRLAGRLAVYHDLRSRERFIQFLHSTSKVQNVMVDEQRGRCKVGVIGLVLSNNCPDNLCPPAGGYEPNELSTALLKYFFPN